MKYSYSYEDCKYLHKKLWHTLGTMSKEELKKRMIEDPMSLKTNVVRDIVENLYLNDRVDLDVVTPLCDCWACEECDGDCTVCPIDWGGDTSCSTEDESDIITAYDIFYDFLCIGTNPKWLHVYPVYSQDYVHFTLYPDLPIVCLFPDYEPDPTYYDFHGTVFAKNGLTVEELIDIYYDEYVEACLWIRDAWK